jgi:hypothetical protein
MATTVKCEYLKDGECSSILNSAEGRSARKDNCKNKSKSSCCYICSLSYVCEFSCDYLGEKKCLLCGSEMYCAKIDLRVGGWEGFTKAVLGPGLGEIGEMSEKKLPVIVYVCSNCNKLDFFVEEKAKKKFWSIE